MGKHLQRQIENLKEQILNVGRLVEQAIANAVTALVTLDPVLAEKTIAEDTIIDRMEVDVEEECLKILALYQPVAGDLRFVIAVAKINNDLERMGDLASNIAKRAAFLSHADSEPLAYDFREMAAKVQRMVKQSLEALVNADSDLARQVRADDDDVDELRQVVGSLVIRKIQERPERTEQLMKIGAVSKHLERIADTAKSIAEDVIFMVDGDIVRHHITDDL